MKPFMRFCALALALAAWPLGAQAQEESLHASPATARPLAPMASPSLLDRSGVAGATSVDQAASIRVRLFDADAPLQVEIEAMVLRDYGANHAALLAVRASRDFGRLRIALAERVDHTFLAGRDNVDLYTSAGASLAVARAVRVGLEYVAQDLEDLFEDDVDGGLRQFVGAQAQLTLRGGWLFCAGPTVALDVSHSLGAHAALGRTF